MNFKTKILIVEDFKASRIAEIDILRELGFGNIVEAEHGESAINILKAQKDIGLIISDWNMPDINGYELLVWTRSQKDYKDVPFVMVTAQAEKKQVEKTYKAGAVGFITKPFDARELKNILDSLLDTAGVPGSMGREPEPESVSPASGLKKTGSGLKKIRVGHIQITDHLVLGVLKHMINTGEYKPRYFELETRCLKSWNQVQKSLETKELDSAFILAPIAMDMFAAGVPIKLVLFSHKNGSICVRNNKDAKIKSIRSFFKNKKFFIPHILSVHHMLSSMFFNEIGLKAGMMGKEVLDIIYEVVPPVIMPDYMKQNPETCGFMVAQPIGAKTVSKGGAELMFLSGELWENHPCCIVAAQDDFINENTDAVHEFVDLLVKAGMYISQNPAHSAQIGVDFLDSEKKLGLNPLLLEEVLNEKYGIKTDNLFPVIEDIDKMQRYMKEKMGIGTLIDLEKFIDLRFAEHSCPKTGQDQESLMHDPWPILQRIMKG